MFKWKILGFSTDKDKNIVEASYFVTLETKKGKVETQGNCIFETPKKAVLEDVSEEIVIEWVQRETTKNNVRIIEAMLEEQLNKLETQPVAELPWVPKTFTIEF